MGNGDFAVAHASSPAAWAKAHRVPYLTSRFAFRAFAPLYEAPHIALRSMLATQRRPHQPNSLARRKLAIMETRSRYW